MISNLYPSKRHISYGIFVKKFEEAIELKGIRVYRKSVISGKGRNILSKLVRYIKFYALIILNVLKDDCDILYVHYISNSSPVLFPLWKFIKKPIVINFHGGDLLKITGLEKFTNRITSFLIERASLLVVPSDYFKEEVLERYNVRPEIIHVYPSGGIDLSIFKPDNSKSILKSDWRLTDELVIGLVARIDYGKRWDIFLEAIDLLKRNYPSINCKAVIVGNGLEIDRFHAKVKQLGIADQVIFLGEKDHKELPMIYNLMDVFVFPTDNESLGLVGLEAMACGIPVIAPYVGGIRGYLKNGVNGYCLKSLTKESIVECLKRFFYEDKGAKALMSEKAMLTSREFEAQKVTNDLANKLESLVREAKP
jgi:glycosyltransferase involved in cell wall biosynthesis